MGSYAPPAFPFHILRGLQDADIRGHPTAPCMSAHTFCQRSPWQISVLLRLRDWGCLDKGWFAWCPCFRVVWAAEAGGDICVSVYLCLAQSDLPDPRRHTLACALCSLWAGISGIRRQSGLCALRAPAGGASAPRRGYSLVALGWLRLYCSERETEAPKGGYASLLNPILNSTAPNISLHLMRVEGGGSMVRKGRGMGLETFGCREVCK